MCVLADCYIKNVVMAKLLKISESNYKNGNSSNFVTTVMTCYGNFLSYNINKICVTTVS